jgi:2-oxoglutarate/2-oxoacid ferredoxin oxidoreductase subunit alpha
MSSVITLKITGPAGAGIKSSGVLFSKFLLAHGLNLRDYSEYPSLVRGGHNSYQVSFSEGEVFAPHYNVDLLFSLLPNHWQIHDPELVEGCLIFADDGNNVLPLSELSKQFGSALYSNTICLGVAVFVLGLNKDICQKLVLDQFGADSPNIPAFLSGFDYATKNFSNLCLNHESYVMNRNSNLLYEGNDAFAWGFIQGGGNFYAAYPMTPSSGVLHLLAAKQEKYNIKVIHAEDEIACASLAVGATFAGARAATGTSGGGFALMTENVSLCGAADLGTVFYLASRPGPATGLPTWTGQSDLLFAVHSGHGEFNKIVLAPGDQQESFDIANAALNLGAKFNVPVIVVSDKFLAESGASLPDLSKVKYPIVTSEKPIPGMAGKEYMANSYEHDEQGFSVEDSASIIASVLKRKAQLEQIKKSLPSPKIYGNKSASKLIVSWGSTKSTILETLNLIENNQDYAFLQVVSMWPLNSELESIIKNYQEIIVIENNATSQLTTLLKSQFDFTPTKIILKYDGRPFFPEELIEKFKNLNI